MAEGGRVITLESIEREIKLPTLRLKLRGPGSTSQAQAEKCSSIFESTKTSINSIFDQPNSSQRPFSSFFNGEEFERRKTAENREKLRKKFADCRNRIDEAEKEALKGFDKLPLEQQEEVIKFWDVSGLIVEFLKKAFNFVLDKIKEGYRLCKEAIKGLFNSITNFFKDLFV